MRPWLRRSLIFLVVVGVPLALAFQFLWETWTIPSDDTLLSASILPQLEKGDLVVVSRSREPSVGKTVRCEDPQQPGRFVVGRLVTANGGVVNFRSEGIDVNGVHEVAVGKCDHETMNVIDPRTGTNTPLACWREPFHGKTVDLLYGQDARRPDIEAQVDQGRGYIVSDNRHFHLDSRDFGLVSLNTCSDVLFRLRGENSMSGKFSIIW